MRSLRQRLERLEGKTEKSVEDPDWYQRYLWMQRHYFPVLENYHANSRDLILSPSLRRSRTQSSKLFGSTTLRPIRRTTRR